MKILEINKFNYPKGGADRHFLDIVSLLKSRGHKVAVFSMKNSKNKFSSWNKYFISYVGYNKNDSNLVQKIIGIGRIFYSFEAKRKIKKVLDDFQPDIVHLHNIYHQISFSIISEIKKRNIPIIMTVHDYHLISPDKDKFLEKVGQKYWKFLFLSKKYNLAKKLILVLKSYWEDFLGWKKEINLFIVPSQFVVKKLEKWGIESKKILHLPHFIPDSNLSENFKSQKNNNYALYFGRISKNKGVPELIKIFKDIKGIKLYIAGEIEDNTKIVSNKNIIYLGKLSKSEIKKYINSAMFCISLSQLPETFGLIALESNALGKPFIGLDAGAYKEIVEQGKTGFICKNSDDVKKIINKIVNQNIILNEEKIKQITQMKFGEDNYYQKFIEIIHGLDFF